MIRLSGNTIETTNINCSTTKTSTITSDNDTVVVSKPLYQSDIEHDTKVTITAPTVDLVGTINRNGSSYTDEILSLIPTHSVKQLTSNLIWTVDWDSPISETNFKELDSAFAKAMKYSQSTKHTITINIVKINVPNPQLVIENCDMSHVILTGTLPSPESDPPTYEGDRYTLNFKNCVCPKICAEIQASSHTGGTCYFINSKATHVEILGDYNAEIKAIDSNVNIVGKLGTTIAINSTITCTGTTIQAIPMTITNSRICFHNCTYSSTPKVTAYNSDILITEGSPTFGSLDLNSCNFSIEGATATSILLYARIKGGRFSIRGGALTTNTSDAAFLLSAGANLTLYVYGYTASNCTHVQCSASRACLCGLGALTGNLFEAIGVFNGGIVSLSGTSGTTNIPLNTITADGLVIG